MVVRIRTRGHLMSDTLPTGLISVASDFAAPAFDTRTGWAPAFLDRMSGALHCQYAEGKILSERLTTLRERG